MRRYSEQELRALPHESLVRLVLELQSSCSRSAPAEVHGPVPSKPTSPSTADTEREPLPIDTETEEGWVLLHGSDESDNSAERQPDRPQVLERGLCEIPANLAAASKLRRELAQAIDALMCEQHKAGDDISLRRLTSSSFFLPEMRGEDEAFREYIRSKLTAGHYQNILERAQVVNWAIGHSLGKEHRLVVLWTLADGNCLLHAALLATWGLQDTHSAGPGGFSTLRAAMSRLLVAPSLSEKFRKRWAEQIARDNCWTPGGDGATASCHQHKQAQRVELSEAQLKREWDEMIEIAGRPNAFLDSVHVLAVAHVFRRPIIVLASSVHHDPFGEPLTPVFFRGVYLPYELPPEDCCRQPLVLCFQDSHFMPLVPLAAPSASAPVLVPLRDHFGNELPLRFAFRGEIGARRELLERYMDLMQIEGVVPKDGGVCEMAVIHHNSQHPLVKEMLGHFIERGKETFVVEQQNEKSKEEKKEKMEATEQAESVKRRKQEEEDFKLARSLAADQDGGLVHKNGGHASNKAKADQDAFVTDKFNLTLANGLRPSDKSIYTMPEGCTDPAQIQFEVPAGCYGGDVIVLTAKYAIKGHCIRSMQDVTGVSREEAVRRLTQFRGSTTDAVQAFFDKN